MLREIKKTYQKYRWFVTSSGKLVVGGKSSEQNELLVKKILKSKRDLVMMHTSLPSSPFTVILANLNKITKEDLEETAIFTACFSQQWKKKKKKVRVDMFTSKQVNKRKKMKIGTFGVYGKISGKKVKLKLILCFQKGILRAVPLKSFNKTYTKMKIPRIILEPGKIGKKEAALKIKDILENDKIKVKIEEIEQAIPSGGFKILR